VRAPTSLRTTFYDKKNRKNLWRNGKAIPLKAKALSFLAYANDKGNFGFELKYSKNLAPKGNFVYVWRGEDGFDYRVKSTSWQKGNLGLAFTSATTATFSGNCVVQKIDPATGYGVESWGNSKLTVKIEDNDMKLPQSTGTDRIQITVDASGDGPDRTIAMTGISGGNIVIHSK